MRFDKRATETAEKILKAFETPETLPEAIAPIFVKRYDSTPCRKWSYRNQLLTALALTDDARGFKQWQQVDRKVKKGAKAFYILSPCTKKIEKPGEEPSFALFGFRGTPVFRFQDTEGEPLPERDPDIDNWITQLPLIEVAQAWGISVDAFADLHFGSAGSFGPSDKSIALHVKEVNTFFHELMHAADHRLGNMAERGQHWRSETVAEFGAAILCECLGIEKRKSLGGAYQYIEAYAKASEKTPVGAVMECLDRICQAVSSILDTAETLAAQTVTA